ncbi:AraC family transcriptional regulator [Arcicella rosea]|uniref:AraC-like DNA-binding protein n=1 Tax=Arcicella rosea TaxID=502909 RepID=A0A841EIH1_9BACT|nr:AraC family transcriptional regulator [Arcicella rosea]MBB6003242.1 AraC-like DNA-binding protein [Arcicella rosea]
MEYLKNEIVRIVYIIGIIVAIFSFPYLKSKNKANIFLSLHFLTMGIFALYYLSALKNKNEFLISFFYGIILPISLLTRPFAYWYVKFMLLKKIRFNKWDLLIVLPGLLCFIDIIPQLFSSNEHKHQIAKLILEDINNIFIYTPTYFFNFKFYFVLRPFLNLTLSVAQLYLLYRHLKSHSFQKIIFTSTIKWLWIFSILSVLLTITLTTLTILFSNNYKLSENIGLFFNDLMDYAIFVYFILNISIFFFPRVLYGISDEGEELFIEEKLTEVKTEKSNKPNFKLDDAKLAEINSIIENYFLHDKPYLNDNFTIIELSESLNIPIHHLSYYFNYHLSKKFSDYKNEWRINYAIQLLKDGILKKYTIDQLYHEAGFSTKSNFYRVFRLHTGKTPIEFLEDLKH